jgi:hypothetical protein
VTVESTVDPGAEQVGSDAALSRAPVDDLGEVDTGDVDAGGGKQRTSWRDLVRPSGYFVLSRAAVVFAALVSKWIFPNLNIPNAFGQGWDGYWYVKIAQHWYPHHLLNEGGGSRWAYFPAFPASIKGAAAVTGLSEPNAAILVTFLFGLLSAIAVWLAVREVFGPTVADRTVLLYVFFPTAFVLSMAYTEGLFIAASALCLYALSRRAFVSAGCFAAVASLTRSFGAVLIVCVVVVAVPAVLAGKDRVRAIVGVLVSGLPLVAWLAYSWHETGTPLAFVKAEKYWGGSHFVWFKAPFQSLGELFTGFHAFHRADYVLAAGGLLLVVAGLAVLAWAQRAKVPVPLFWWVFTVGSVLGAMSPYWPNSVLRYTMVLIPCLAAFAWAIRPTWTGAVVGTLAVSQGALAIIILVGLAHPQATLLAP